MIVFSCLNCGNAVNKTDVENHLFKCHGIIKLSCIKCSKIFKEDTYKNHTTCVAESSGETNVLYGLQKKEDWIKIVELIVQNQDEFALSSYLLRILNRLPDLDNIPRKYDDFINVVMNSLNMEEPRAKCLWDILKKASNMYK